MKKALMLVAAVAAFSASTSASALTNLSGRFIRSGVGDLGFIDSMAPLGRTGQFCTYLMNWASPFNPNAVLSCVLAETRTILNPSCILNSIQDSTAAVLGGLASPIGVCEGFDNLGIAYSNISVIATSTCYGLEGVVIYDGCLSLPFVV